MEKFNVLIFDDHRLFTSSFSTLLKTTGKFQLIITCNTIHELNEELSKNIVSHLFIDYLIPGIDVLAEIKRISLMYPSVKIIVVSSITNAHLVYQLHKSGAHGFISKNSEMDEILECLSSLGNKKYFVCKHARNGVLDIYLNGKEIFFTESELRIMQHIVNGSTIEEIAEKMYLSRHTIVAHRRNMMEKFKVKSVTSLLKIAMEMGVVG